MILQSLLYVSVPLLFGLSPMVSMATSVQQVAQAVPKVGMNRPTLKVGSQGVPVSELQAALKLLGFYTGEVDGVYNESTASAVSRFQEAAGVTASGVVDDNTWEKLFPSVSSSSVATTPSASRFPVPSQPSNSDRNVVVPTSTRTSTTTTRTTANTKPEPRPTTATRTTTNTKPEPRPTTATRTTTNTKPEPRPTTRVATTNASRSSVQQTSSSRSNSSNQSRQTTRVQQTAQAASSTRVQQNTRVGSSNRTEQTAYVQYTSEGFPILRAGMQGSEVVKLQQRLQSLGLLASRDVDGDFGDVTEAAVINFQRRNGLEADGVVGGATWEALMRRGRR